MKRALFLLLLLVALVHAHGQETPLEEELTTNTVNYILIAGAIAMLATLVAVFWQNKTEEAKWVLFLAIAVPVSVATIYAGWATVYINTTSETSGPVHWHADFEVWKCGEKINLRDPTGIENRVGSPVFHEHGDARIHVEGVLVETKHAALHKFFEVTGGALEEDYLAIPTNNGLMRARNGEKCQDKEASVQVFLYRVLDAGQKPMEYAQEKLVDFPEYVLSPHSIVPPGDCIIIEFDQEKDSTDKICETYRIGIEKGELIGS